MTLRAIFFGTPQFAATILGYLLEKNIEIVAVVTKPDRPQKRSKAPIAPPVKEVALIHKILVYQPAKASAPEFVEQLKKHDADLFLVAAYSEIFKDNLLAAPKIACINVHASILPKYRGAAPIHYAIWQGEVESGVTIMKMAPKLDAGRMYKIARTPITDEMTSGELTKILADLGAHALWDVIEQIEAGKATPVVQNESQVSVAPKLKMVDGQVQWDQPANLVYNHVRAMTPKPGAWCWVMVKGKKKKLLIKQARVVACQKQTPGTLLAGDSKTLLVACADGALQLLCIQLESKKEMAVAQFLNGIAKTDINFLF